MFVDDKSKFNCSGDWIMHKPITSAISMLCCSVVSANRSINGLFGHSGRFEDWDLYRNADCECYVIFKQAPNAARWALADTRHGLGRTAHTQ